MNILHLTTREIAHRKLSFGIGVLSIAIAVGALMGSLILLKAHDQRTATILREKEEALVQNTKALDDDVRRAMLKLGFNLVIIPKDQNLGDWYADDYAAKSMPEEYVTRLAESGIVTVRHFLPSLQQRITWPEKKRTIILVGTRGEVPNLHKNLVKPLVQPVPAGTIVLGYELHNSMGLKEGDEVTLMGRQLAVHQCYDERGTKDDITAWISLPEAQELLDKKGKINAILALQCNCPGSEIHNIRREIAKTLPDTKVVERASKLVAREEARYRVKAEGRAALQREIDGRNTLRQEREQLTALLIPIIMIACAAWVGFLAFGNVRDREAEIGILRSLGVGSMKIFAIFLLRAAAMGVAGGALGLLAGLALGQKMAVDSDAPMILLALLVAPILSLVASWIPALIATQQDPAEILRKE
ncbi:MAG: hypothetical protein QGH29_00385 [Kiritimatiellia bacterium]|nr:hypothetical protein [Kiritimatiellia bacterium]MDP6809528.1 hypothetical protein [Kiritimatiellia bacterium]